MGAVNPQIHGSDSPIEALLDAPRRGLLDADGAERAQERPKKNRTRHRRKRWKSNRYRAPARRNEYERVVNIARDFSLCRWARRLLLDRRCANLSAAFSRISITLDLYSSSIPSMQQTAVDALALAFPPVPPKAHSEAHTSKSELETA